MFVYGRNIALSFVFANENDEYLHKKGFLVVFLSFIYLIFRKT